jgi:hypothetical protein
VLCGFHFCWSRLRSIGGRCGLLIHVVHCTQESDLTEALSWEDD